jgi:chorismate mutase
VRGAAAVCGLVVALASVHASARADDANPLFDLVDAAVQRLQTAEPVAAVKWQTNGSIEDPPRVAQVLAAVTADASGRGIDPGYVSAVFTDQINATEAIEYTRFAQWKLDPGSAPTAPPDLAASRDAIDGLNREMVGQIALHWQLLHSPECAVDLDGAKAAVAGARNLDPFYRQTISSSTRSYCTPRSDVFS